MEKKLRLSFIAILMVCSIFSNGQVPSLEWAGSLGIGFSIDGNDIVTDNSGNVYTTGSFAGTTDFDFGTGVLNMTSNGNAAVFIQKVDQNSNLIWAKSIGNGLNNGIGYSLNIDLNNNVLITGSFEGIMDADPGTGIFNLTSIGLSDIFILKLDPLGNFLWARSMGGINEDQGSSITTDGIGNIYTTGHFKNSVDFDPGIGVSNFFAPGITQGTFTQKLDVNGNYIWNKIVVGNDDNWGIKIETDGSDNIYLLGFFKGTSDFNPSGGVNNVTSQGNQDVFIQKFNANGNLIWAKFIMGPGPEIVKGFSVDQNGFIYLAGDFWGGTDFDPGPGTIGLPNGPLGDCFVEKLDSAGNYLWVKSFGGAGVDQSRSISTDSQGNIYSTGIFLSDTIDVDPGVGITNLTLNGTVDIYVQKLDPNGEFIWGFSMGSTVSDQSRSMAIDNNDNLYLIGFYASTMDVEPGPGVTNLTAIGGQNIFVLKLGFTVGIDEHSFFNLSLYPNPASNSFNIKGLNKPYSISIYNSIGQLLHYNINALEQSKRVDVSTFNNGVLFVRIESEGQIFQSKVLKIKTD